MKQKLLVRLNKNTKEEKTYLRKQMTIKHRLDHFHRPLVAAVKGGREAERRWWVPAFKLSCSSCRTRSTCHAIAAIQLRVGQDNLMDIFQQLLIYYHFDHNS